MILMTDMVSRWTFDVQQKFLKQQPSLEHSLMYFLLFNVLHFHMIFMVLFSICVLLNTETICTSHNVYYMFTTMFAVLAM